MSWLADRGLEAAVLDSLTASICVLDRAGIIVATNEAWRRFSGRNVDPASFLGASYLEACMGTSTGRRIVRLFDEVLGGRRERFEFEYACHGPQEKRWFLCRATPLRLAEGSDPLGAVVSHQDITERKLLEITLERLTVTDELTGLANRRHFLDAARRALTHVKMQGAPSCMILVDLDHFKRINDAYGHEAGDEALRFAAKQMKSVLRARDLVARIGGEELAVLPHKTDEWGGVMLAERMRSSLAAAPVKAGSVAFTISASFGVSAILPSDGDPSEAMARADKMLYRAKAAGRNRVFAHSSGVFEMANA